MKGRIISFEGIDGSGKSTQSKIFADHLLSLGKKVKYLREPGSTDLGQEIRGIVKRRGDEICKFAELFLFFYSKGADGGIGFGGRYLGVRLYCDGSILS